MKVTSEVMEWLKLELGALVSMAVEARGEKIEDLLVECATVGIEVEVDTGSLERRGATLCRVEVVQCPLLHQNREERRSN